MNCDRFEMSEDKPADLVLLLRLLAQVDVDVVVTVRTGVQHNLSGSWSNTKNVPFFHDFTFMNRIIPPFSPYSLLTGRGLWSHSSGSGWFLAGASLNTNMPAEMNPTPSYQQADRKYETRRETAWQTEGGRDINQNYPRFWAGLKANKSNIRWPRRFKQDVFSPFSVDTLEWFNLEKCFITRVQFTWR